MCFLQDTIEYMTVCVCVNFMKKSFSQTVSDPEFLLSTYNISTDQSKDDYHLETAGDYVLNTLLVSRIFVYTTFFFFKMVKTHGTDKKWNRIMTLRKLLNKVGND